MDRLCDKNGPAQIGTGHIRVRGWEKGEAAERWENTFRRVVRFTVVTNIKKQ
jgi:hypothetical protein